MNKIKECENRIKTIEGQISDMQKMRLWRESDFSESFQLLRDLYEAKGQLERARGWSCWYQERIADAEGLLEFYGSEDVLREAIKHGEAMQACLHSRTARVIKRELESMKSDLDSICDLAMYREQLTEFGTYRGCGEGEGQVAIGIKIDAISEILKDMEVNDDAN